MPYVVGAIVLIVVAVGFTFIRNGSDTAPVATQPVETEVMQETSELVDNVPAPVASDYTDGSYTTSVTYFTPMQSEYHLDVTLTLASDVVVDANIVYSNGAEKDPNAQRFEAAYQAEVIGMDIDSLNLSRVGGASLTTGAFNDALAKIKVQADA